MVGKDPRDAVLLTPTDLLSDDVSRIAIGDPSLAPAGSYAREALQGMGLWEQLESKLVYGLNVRTALQYVSTGNADVAIVYATDAASDDTLRVLWAFPPESHSPIRYPVAALNTADNPSGAEAFLTFLHSEAASLAFREQGFAPIDSQ
jgi:molybdate transport system substrate-binding protein